MKVRIDAIKRALKRGHTVAIVKRGLDALVPANRLLTLSPSALNEKGFFKEAPKVREIRKDSHDLVVVVVQHGPVRRAS